MTPEQIVAVVRLHLDTLDSETGPVQSRAARQTAPAHAASVP
jgi:hypothetical protein